MGDLSKEDIDDIDDIIEKCEELADCFPANSHKCKVNKRMAEIARHIKYVDE